MTTAQQTADSAAQRELTTAEVQQRARQFVRDYIDRHGKEPTGEQVGRANGMGDRWGRNQIAAVRGERAGTAPARQADASGTARGTVERHSGTAERHGSGTEGPAAAVIGGTVPAPTAARPPAPPARPGTPSGTGSARPNGTAAPSGTTAARPSGTAARPSGTAAAQPAARAHDSGKAVAWSGFALGVFVSVAGNVMHALIPRPPEGLDAAAWIQPKGWAPDPAAVIGGAFWPIMLLLAVEVMTRVHWSPGFWWAVARFGGVGLVALGSAVISYGHIRDVLMAWHYDDFAAHIGPLVVDGFMVICGVALLSISKARHDGSRS